MIDASLIFDGTLDTTGAAGPTGVAITTTRVSTNVIDWQVARDVGVNDDLEVHVIVTTAFTAAGAATLQIEYQTSTDNSTFYGVLLSEAYPVANLVAGAPIFRYKVPLAQLLQPNTPQKPARYARLNYTVATGPMTAGAVTAFITGMDDRQSFIPYGPNYSEQ